MSKPSNINGIDNSLQQALSKLTLDFLDKNTTLDEIKPPVADVDFNDQGITNLKDPTNDKDGANKEYVDDTIATALDETMGIFQTKADMDDYYTKLQTTGILLGYQVIEPLDDLPIAQGTLNLNNNRIQNVSDPVDVKDAVNLQYFQANLVQEGDTIINNITNEITNNYYDKTTIDQQVQEINDNVDTKVSQETLNNGLPSDLNVGGNNINNLQPIPVDGAFQVPVSAMPFSLLPLAPLAFPLVAGFMPIAPLAFPVAGLFPAINDDLLGNAVPFSFLNDLLQYLMPISASINQLQGIPASPLLLGNQPIQQVSMDPNDVSGTQVANQGYVDQQIQDQQSYTDTQVQEAVQTAEEYTDTQISSHTHDKIINGATEVYITTDNKIKMKINNIDNQLTIQNTTGQALTNTQIISTNSMQFLSGTGSTSFNHSNATANVQGLYVQLADNQSVNKIVQVCVQATNSNPALTQNLTLSSGHFDTGSGQQAFSVLANQAGGLQQNLQISAGTPQIDATLTLLSRSYATLLSMMPFQFTDATGYSQTTQITNNNQFTSKTYVDAISTNLSTNYYNKTDSDARYALTSALSAYLTTANASTTYQTIAGMASYLTTTTAQATYQTLAGMASYVTSNSLTSTLADYVTSSTLTSTLLNYLPSNTRLDQITVPTASVNLNGQRLTNGSAGVNPDDYVILSQVTSGTQNVWAGRITLGTQTTLTTAQALSSPAGIILSGTKIASPTYGSLMNLVELQFNTAVLPVDTYTMQITLLNNYSEANQDYNSDLAQEGIIVQSVSRAGATLMWKTTTKLQALNSGLRIMIALILL